MLSYNVQSKLHEYFEGFRGMYLNGNCPRSGVDPLSRKKLNTMMSIFPQVFLTAFDICWTILQGTLKVISWSISWLFLPRKVNFCHSYWLRCKYNCSLDAYLKIRCSYRNELIWERLKAEGQARLREYLSANRLL